MQDDDVRVTGPTLASSSSRASSRLNGAPRGLLAGE